MSARISNTDDSPDYSIIVNWRNWNDKRSETAKTRKACALHRPVMGHTGLYHTSGRKLESDGICRVDWRGSSSLIPKSMQYFSRVFATRSTLLQVMLTTLYHQSVEHLFPFTLGHVRTSKFGSTAEVSKGGWTASSSSRFFEGTRNKNLRAKRKTRILMCKKLIEIFFLFLL